MNNEQELIEMDKSDMMKSIISLPEQIKESKDIVEKSELGKIFKVDNIIISGMGASAISGDILLEFLRDKIDIPIYVNRRYDLPYWAHKDTLVISQSYSGDTAETLAAFKHAYQKKCNIIGISSGGKLEEYCKKREVNHIKIPSGFQPRASIGYILFSSLYSLLQSGAIRLDIENEIQETIKITEELRNHNKKEILEKDNLAKQTAKKIYNTLPHVYGWQLYTPVAKRWCTQFNENSKIICRYAEVSECNHNDIVGWSMNPEISKKSTCIVFRDSENETIYMSKRLDFMKKLFSDVSAGLIEIPARGHKRLAKIMYLLYLGDFISYYLAILRKVDPTPITAINELKNELSKL